MKILLIGTGRIAMNLGHAINSADLELCGLAGRDPARVRSLAETLGTKGHLLGGDLPAADIVLLAVSDDAIGMVGSSLGTVDATVVHTSGTTALDVTGPHERRGVIWPVQTFAGTEILPMKNVPLIIEGSDPAVLGQLRDLASRLGGRVMVMEHAQRQRLHMAAVIMSNFPVALALEAQRLLEQQELPPDLLLPLWRQAATNIEILGPAAALTGPARRGDQRTIDRHMEMLAADGGLQDIYRLLSARITERHHGQ